MVFPPVLAFARCAPDPSGLAAPLVCAYTDDYFAFARADSRAPLLLASGAYVAYALLRVDFGHYEKTARLLTCALVQALAWVALAALELLVVGGYVSAARAAWSPGFALLGAPAALWGGLALALLVDVALGTRPALRLFTLHDERAGRVALRALARIVGACLAAAVPAAAVAATLCAERPLYTWIAGATGLALVAAAGVVTPPLVAAWLACVHNYTGAYVVLLNALVYGALVALGCGATRWGAARRRAAVSHYGRMAPRKP